MFILLCSPHSFFLIELLTTSLILISFFFFSRIVTETPHQGSVNKLLYYCIVFIAREVVNIFPQYIAVQSRASRFSWSLYSAQTLDQAICWRSKMCFQKFIIYILRYTHRKAPFIRTWVLAIQYVRKKNDTSNQIPRRRCVSLAPKFPPFFGACRLQRTRYANCFSQI